MPKEHQRKHLQRPEIKFAEWNAEANIGGLTLDKAVTARTEHYLDRSERLEVDIEELDNYLLGPEELDVDIRHIALTRRKASKAFPHVLVSRE